MTNPIHRYLIYFGYLTTVHDSWLERSFKASILAVLKEYRMDRHTIAEYLVYMMRAILSGRGEEIVELAKTNLR